MVDVAKRFTKQQVTVRVHPQNLAALQSVGEQLMLNTSEMMDRAIEHYLREGAEDDLAEAKARRDTIRSTRRS